MPAGNTARTTTRPVASINPVFPSRSKANSFDAAPTRFAQIRGTLTIVQAPPPSRTPTPAPTPAYPYPNRRAARPGSATFSADSTPATGNPAGSSNPNCTSTDA